MHFRCWMVNWRASSVVYVCFIVISSSTAKPRSKKKVGRKSWLVTSASECTKTFADCVGTTDNAHFLSVSNKSLIRSFRTLLCEWKKKREKENVWSDKNHYDMINLLILGRSVVASVERITKSVLGVQRHEVVATWNVFVLVLAQLEEILAGNGVFER